ncbi:hypothetical protein BD311DRAFT_757977 [Dichomitus squalens]|uniref:Uncharacterized protein n=1 Tax=Dichomitus squalens TaxID=114155 RepID=A0A4Q9MNP3_9APHY|nr:hypothetical protein BD311DRAFT_757977 [Dichomitus squalens]
MSTGTSLFAALTDTVATFLDALAMEVFGVRVRLRGVDCVQARAPASAGDQGDRVAERERVRGRVRGGLLGAREEGVGGPVGGEPRGAREGHQPRGHEVAAHQRGP